nr:uncharacterized protein CI109_006591 [Kwoniella shandongensis]KAA5525040.1 hypothetical protein CI109_006591 [Kwoniella shandongensis]
MDQTRSFTSRLSPFPLSLFNSSPRAIPSIPTLAELQKRAEAISSSSTVPIPVPAVAYSTTSLGHYDSQGPRQPRPHLTSALPTQGGIPIPQPIPIPHTDAQSYPSPPAYDEKSPLVNDSSNSKVGRKLKKPRPGWKKVQDCIPGEEGPNGHTMRGSKVYVADSVRSREQPSIQQFVGYEEPKRTWLEWSVIFSSHPHRQR